MREIYGGVKNAIAKHFNLKRILVTFRYTETIYHHSSELLL